MRLDLNKTYYGPGDAKRTVRAVGRGTVTYQLPKSLREVTCPRSEFDEFVKGSERRTYTPAERFDETRVKLGPAVERQATDERGRPLFRAEDGSEAPMDENAGVDAQPSEPVMEPVVTYILPGQLNAIVTVPEAEWNEWREALPA